MKYAMAAVLFLLAQDDPKPGRLRLPSTRKLETLLNTKDRAIIWRAVDFGSMENEALKTDGTKIRGEMTLSLVWARFADADKSEVKGIRMVFEAKEKGAVAAARVSVVDVEDLDKLIAVLGMIEAIGKEAKGENVDYHLPGGVSLRGAFIGKLPVFQICVTPEGGRVGHGDFLQEPPAVAAQLKQILQGAQAKLKE